MKRGVSRSHSANPGESIQAPERTYADSELLRRLLREARPQWPHLVALSVISMLATPLALLVPLPLKIAVDSVIGSHPAPAFLAAVIPGRGKPSDALLLVAIALLYLAIALAIQVQLLVSGVLTAYTGEKLLLRFRSRIFRHVQGLSLAYHDTRGTTDAIYRIQYDATSIQWLATFGIIPLATAVMTVVGMIWVTAQLDSQLALVILLVVPAFLFLTRVYRNHLRIGWGEAKALESSGMTVAQEALSALRVVKAFGAEDREQARFVERFGLGTKARVRLAISQGIFSMLIALSAAAGIAAVLYVGVRHVKSGALTLGGLLLVMGYMAELYDPLQTISKAAATVQQALASAERAFTILDEEPDVPERPDAIRVDRAAGAVEFQDVTFAYGEDPAVLRGISFAVASGVRAGIAGTTGSGKTTLISLLTRFYDPSGGRILLDGADLRDLRLTDVRRQFSIVLQEPVLFSTTIAENIAYGRPDATSDQIIEAARAANAHDFVRALPDGYATEVGERGMRLSGGERQRISLARAFLKDAPILVLDEPTSSVDVHTETAIMEAMERLMKGRTTFLIAHRLSTLTGCDVRLQVEKGRLVEPASGGPRRRRRRLVPIRSRAQTHRDPDAWSG
jgi:ATP-binding cassette subfamily B protein